MRALARGARKPATLAARFGRTADEMDALLARAHMLTPQDRAAVGRIEHALRTGARVDPQDVRHIRQSLDQLGFVVDLAPTHGDIFLFPDFGPPNLGRYGARGESAETAAIHSVNARAAGVMRKPRHHVLPREHRQWFEERGFIGDRDIDNYTVELDQADHQAIHGGGNWRLGRTWTDEWNRGIMTALRRREHHEGRMLRAEEVLAVVEEWMARHGIRGPFVRYNR